MLLGWALKGVLGHSASRIQAGSGREKLYVFVMVFSSFQGVGLSDWVGEEPPLLFGE